MNKNALCKLSKQNYTLLKKQRRRRRNIGRGLCAIRTDENVDRQYLLAYLRSIENELLKMGSGTTFQSITIEDVRKIIIPLLPLDEQKRIIQIIETKLHTVEKAKKAAAEQFQSIDALSSSVLRQALRGKL
jgi:type I restriction enzyme S subunit